MDIKDRLEQWCDEAIVVLLCSCADSHAHTFGGTHTGALSRQKSWVGSSLILWGLKLWLKSSHRLFFTPTVWAVLGLTAYAAFEYMRSPIEFSTRQEILKAVLYCSIFFIFINNLRRRRHVKTFAFCLIGIATLISFYAIAQFLSGSTQILWETQAPIYAHRASGTYILPQSPGRLPRHGRTPGAGSDLDRRHGAIPEAPPRLRYPCPAGPALL
jgi:hypothetical protein